jgi:hypothetical protein
MSAECGVACSDLFDLRGLRFADDTWKEGCSSGRHQMPKSLADVRLDSAAARLLKLAGSLLETKAADIIGPYNLPTCGVGALIETWIMHTSGISSAGPLG